VRCKVGVDIKCYELGTVPLQLRLILWIICVVAKKINVRFFQKFGIHGFNTPLDVDSVELLLLNSIFIEEQVCVNKQIFRWKSVKCNYSSAVATFEFFYMSWSEIIDIILFKLERIDDVIVMRYYNGYLCIYTCSITPSFIFHFQEHLTKFSVPRFSIRLCIHICSIQTDTDILFHNSLDSNRVKLKYPVA